MNAMLYRYSLLLLAAALLVPACGGTRSRIPPGVGDADKFLFDRGTEALNDRKWLTAREYMRQLVDSYPQSPYRADAKLGIGDSYLGEGTTEALVLSVNEFREFLTFYPTHARADYAQYKIGMAHFKQMRRPERDQTETRDAIREFMTFIERYPHSGLMNEVKAKQREARDRIGESEYRVGLYYFRAKWYPGAIDRFKTLLHNDPDFTNRDGVYYHLAEALMRTNRQAEALPYFERLLKEFVASEYLEEAQQRVQELKAPASRPAAESQE